MQIKTFCLLGVVAASIAASYGSEASAAFARVHPSGCTLWGPWESADFGVEQTSNYEQFMYCPAVDNDVNQRFQWTTVNVETMVNGYGMYAALCEDLWDNTGGTCTPYQNTTGNGHQTIHLGSWVGNAGTWSSGSEGNFGFVSIGSYLNGEVRGVYYGR